MSETGLTLFQRNELSLTQVMKLHGKRISSYGTLDVLEITPETSDWSTKRILCFRFLVDGSSVCVQICTSKQKGDSKDIPHLDAKVLTDAFLDTLVVKCATCGKGHLTLPLVPQERLQLPSNVSIKVDIANILVSGCCTSFHSVPATGSPIISGNPYLLSNTQRYRIPTHQESHAHKSILFEIVLSSCESNPSKTLSVLLDRRLHTDLTLRVGADGTELRAHRSVLAACSPVFMSMFESEAGFAESRLGVVDVKGVRVEVMEAALRHMYGKDAIGSLDSKTRMDLLVLAERYQMQGLKELCERTLAQDTSADPLVLLALADVHNAQILMEAVIERMLGDVDKTNALIQQACPDDFVAAHPQIVKKLIERLCMRISK